MEGHGGEGAEGQVRDAPVDVVPVDIDSCDGGTDAAGEIAGQASAPAPPIEDRAEIVVPHAVNGAERPLQGDENGASPSLTPTTLPRNSAAGMAASGKKAARSMAPAGVVSRPLRGWRRRLNQSTLDERQLGAQ